MEDTLVSSALAKKAKKKGFNEDCLWVYRERDFEEILHATKILGYRYVTNDVLNQEEYTVPSCVDLQKWFLINHNIHIVVFPVNVDGEIVYTLEICNIKNGTMSDIECDVNSKSLPFTLEKGLEEAFKLI